MKVSIIIPVYNAKDFIVECLDSVATQTMTKGVECILVDDCGQDDSVEVINEYVKHELPRINHELAKNTALLHQPRNQGPSAARNRGIREATGEYIFFLDADDQITPQCIETLYTIAKEYDADYVQGRYNNEHGTNGNSVLTNTDSTDSTNNSIVTNTDCTNNTDNLYNQVNLCSENKKIIKSLLLDHTKIPFTPHNRLVRRKMILEHDLFFNEQIKVREDFLWMTFVAKYVNRFASTDTVTYIRGFNEDSLTHNINREREIQGYRVLIETMCANIDPFLRGKQKELALDALLMALRAGYYHDEKEKQHLVEVVSKNNNAVENCLLKLYLKTNNTKIHHLLLKIYKIID